MPWQPGRPAPLPAAAPPETRLWLLLRRGQSARAVVSEYPHGRELRCEVASRLVWSQLFRPGDVPSLEDVAAEHLAGFIARGWAPPAE